MKDGFCVICGKEIPTPTRGVKSLKYCSRTCYNKDRNLLDREKRNLKLKKKRELERGVGLCPECGGFFKKEKTNRQKFCNRLCQSRYYDKNSALIKEYNEFRKREARDKTKENKGSCIICGNTLDLYQRSFCSKECRGINEKSQPDYRERRAAYQKKYQEKHKDRIAEKRKGYWTNPRTQYLSRVSNLKTKYSITEEDYISFMDKQKGCCAICGESLEYPHVDHCHSTGLVRGLLCKFCNLGIGYFKDKEFLLINASKYIVETKPD